MSKKKFSEVLSLCYTDLLYHSRIHRLATWESAGHVVWVKREDESGFGISGCKKRKYASLIPFIFSNDYKKVVPIGGQHSNNIMGLVQLLHEFRIAYRLYLKSAHTHTPKGNAAFLELLTDTKKNVRWVLSEDWAKVEEIAAKENPEKHTLILPEGSSHTAAIPGLITLGIDIERNEAEKKIHFNQIWIDSGTALTAAVLSYWNIASGRDTTIHTVHTAGSIIDFEKQFQLCNHFFRTNYAPNNVYHYSPTTAKSFGSVNTSVLDFVTHFARTEGILTDPIYTAKLFMTAQAHLLSTPPQGNTLIIHSGGGSGLTGFLPLR